MKTNNINQPVVEINELDSHTSRPLTRNYVPKKVEIVWGQADASFDEIQQRTSEAYEILFKETLAYLRNQKMEGGEQEAWEKNSQLAMGDYLS